MQKPVCAKQLNDYNSPEYDMLKSLHIWVPDDVHSLIHCSAILMGESERSFPWSLRHFLKTGYLIFVIFTRNGSFAFHPKY